jgi:S-DNA-T family DNA segregation ATPase FtsK/SpoIIIE
LRDKAVKPVKDKEKRTKRKRGDSTQKEERVLNEVLGILVVTVALLSAVSFFVGFDVDTLFAVKSVLFAALGYTAVIVPVLLGLLGVWMIWKLPAIPRVSVKILAGGLTVGLWLNWAKAAGAGWMSELPGEYSAGGGVISGPLMSALSSALSVSGAFFIVFAITLLFGKFALNISYLKVGRALQPKAMVVGRAIASVAKAAAGFVSARIAAAAEKRRAVVEEEKLRREKQAEAMAKKLMEEEAARAGAPQSFMDDDDSADEPEERRPQLKDKRKKERAQEEKSPEPAMKEPAKVAEEIKQTPPPAFVAKQTTAVMVDAEGKEETVVWRLPDPEEWLDAKPVVSEAAMDNTMRDKLEATLKNFQVPARIVNVVKGAAFTRFEIELEPGTKVSRIVTLETDIALSLATDSKTIRIEAPIPGKSAVGIEVPNKERAMVPFRKIFLDTEFRAFKKPLSFVLGEDIAGKPVFTNLMKMPHLLVAGSTNSGKSVCINGIICSMIAREFPSDLRLIMIDMKRVELTPYEGIPHLLTPVIKEAALAAAALRWVCEEMDRRYKVFAEAGVRDIAGYNKYVEDPAERMFRMVVIIDELADLMMVSSPNMNVENYICRITQLARATGIHVILATQRPDTKVITGTIKNNIPSRISFAVASQIDSRTVLDRKGAESLLGCGDMLYQPIDSNRMMRLQGAFVSDDEIKRLVLLWKTQTPPIYDTIKFSVGSGADIAGGGGGDSHNSEDENLYRQAVEIVVTTGQCSISMIQRRLRIGYNRAARLVDVMEERHVVGPYDGSRPREVLLSPEELETV